MEEEEDEAIDKPKKQARKTVRKKLKKEARSQSTIGFPYQDLESGIGVARATLGAGGVPLTRDQLAGVMNLAAGSGNFVLKVATARMFGLVNYVGGKYELTQLGFSIVDNDEKRQRSARAEAFLNVPLYKRAYEEFKGKQLPPRPHGLEQAFIKFGVGPKQKSTARLIFDKSAQQAGFFPSGPERLIEPIIGAMSPEERFWPVTDDNGRPAGERVRSAGESSFPIHHEPSGLHPFIQGLLDTLPEPQTTWTVDGRAKWLQAAANIFDLIYKGSGEIKITAKPEPDGSPSV